MNRPATGPTPARWSRCSPTAPPSCNSRSVSADLAAIGFACTVLDREFVPRPLECLPIAEKCANVWLRIIDVIGPELHSRYKFDRQQVANQLADPQLTFHGPDLSGCVHEILRLIARIRPVASGLIVDESALPQVRHAAQTAADKTEFIARQFA
ncbi:hypothetical protein [Nocardia sp. NPDC004860]|uniref:hypothetical protein n=1 Tax=Nocardia sp. NPDC004860 TaxID=3154557 RepID=UPI0033A0A488